MKAVVRDDIIALETFVALRFKYEKYIEQIFDCGGYCFVDQFVQHYGGENKGRYLAEQLEANGLIKTKFFNNYKYCYLTDASIKYVIYKDDPRDFSEIKKANIPVKKITPNPTDKVLFSSALKFALMQQYNFIGKKNFINVNTKIFSALFNTKNNKEELVKKAVEKTVSYYDKSKIIFMISPNNLKLQMIILDTGTRKNTDNYITLLKEYLKFINIKFNSIFIIVASCSSKECKIIVENLNKKVNERIKQVETLKKNYDITPPKKPTSSDSMETFRYKEYLTKYNNNMQMFNFELEKINNVIPPFEVGVIYTAFYMEHYKDRISTSTNYIKPKDIDRFEALREKFKNKR